MATTKITDLTAYTDPVSTDVLPIVDVTSNVTKKVSIANVMKNASLGTAAAPSIAFDGDPNTGIYSPGADQVAISTSGTGRLYIATDGKIGVNVGSPTQAQLVVASSAGANTAFFTDGTNSSIKFLHGGGGAVITTETGQYLGFGTSDAERLRITSDGKVGLGTSSPNSALDVNGVITIRNSGTVRGLIGAVAGDANYVGLQNGALADSFANSAINQNTTGTTTVNSASGQSLSLRIGNSTALHIDSSRNVGVGTTSPTVALDVNGNGSFKSSILITDSQTKIGDNGIIDGGAADGNTQINFFVGKSLILKTGSNERARIDSSGRLGVGTASPLSVLDVQTNAAERRSIRFSGTGISNAEIHCTESGGYNRSLSIGGQEIGFFTDTGGATTRSERARIDSSGRLGIGTTPSYTLDVAGTINSRSADGAAFDALQFYGTAMGTNNKFWRTQITTTDQNWQTVDDAYTTANTWLKATRNGNQVETISFLTGTSGTSERARIDSSGRLLVGTSSDSGGALLQVNGDRIRVGTAKTPASATATGTAGEICWDADYVYVCTATNTWKRSALSTW